MPICLSLSRLAIPFLIAKHTLLSFTYLGHQKKRSQVLFAVLMQNGVDALATVTGLKRLPFYCILSGRRFRCRVGRVDWAQTLVRALAVFALFVDIVYSRSRCDVVNVTNLMVFIAFPIPLSWPLSYTAYACFSLLYLYVFALIFKYFHCCRRRRCCLLPFVYLCL